MKSFNIDRMNLEKIKLGEQPLVLKKTSYPELVIQNNHLVNAWGEEVGTKGDMYTKVIMDKILEKGTLDHDPRPHYEDFYKDAFFNGQKIITSTGERIPVGKANQVFQKSGGIELWTPAHTLSINNEIECHYDLSKGESPLTTLRPIAVKASIAEILWIYQQESNDLVLFDELLGKNTWDNNHEINNWWKDWAIRDKDGNYVLNEQGHPTIGSCYGETVRRRHILKRDVIDAIRNNPDGRRNIACLWQQDDFQEPHGLKPCAFLTIWNVRHEWDDKDYLDMKLIQRSSDFATAGCINQVQYAALLKMVAKDLNMEPGIFTWSPINVQIYDRHIEQAIEMLNREPVSCKAEIKCSERVGSFGDFTTNDIKIEDYPREFIKKKNPPLKFPLGI